MLTCFDFNYYYTLDVNVSSSRNYNQSFQFTMRMFEGKHTVRFERTQPAFPLTAFYDIKYVIKHLPSL